MLLSRRLVFVATPHVSLTSSISAISIRRGLYQMRSWNRSGVFTLSAMALIAVAGCGGGGKSTTPPPPATYAIGGTVTGLTGAGLVLQDNGGNNLTVSANATRFSFTTPLTSGGAYSVTVLTQPAGESCTVTAGSGTASANVTSVSVACIQAYTIGGSVFGLSGTGLALQDNSGNNLTVSAGATSYVFTFPGQIPSGGASYSITVLSNPAGQACTVANPIGTATADVANVDITCTNLAATTYTIGGTVTGLTGPGLILQDDLGINNTDLLPVNGNGSFTFVDPVAGGSVYNVAVLTQPQGRNCMVSNGSGTASANVANVSILCVGDWTWVGGSSTVGSNGGQPGVYGTLGTAASTNIPGGREQALSWTDASGNAWLFGGYGQDSNGSGGLLNDLWRFDQKAGEWTWMGGSTVAPPSTSFGAAGASGVYGTLGTASPANVPGGREQVVSWTDASGNIWVFGGEGIDANGGTGELNDLWEFDPKLGATGEWTWMGGSTSVGSLFGGQSGVYGTLGTASATNVPGGRYGAISWIDAAGNFWLFGGNGIDSTGTLGYLNDLWKYTPGANGSAGQWTWMAGNNTVGNNGGQPGVYGTLGTAASTNIPGGRDAAASWIDASGNVWLFGGLGADSTGTEGFLNDLWKYTPGSNGSAGEWTWMGGNNTVGNNGGQPGVYGTLGTASPANVPGGRFSAVTWVDGSGNLWLFGGDGYDSTGTGGYLNDLWKFEPTLGATGEWTWIGGGNAVGRSGGQSGTYGTLGTPASTNLPGGRFGIVGWVDASGNLWLFGGDGYDSTGAQGNLNDLWEYQP
jgi:N-acetylneuraminic acid mutarotase